MSVGLRPGAVGLVGGKPVPCRLELPHALPAFPLRLQTAHWDDGINSPSPRTPVLNTSRPDLEFAFIQLQDDAAIVVSLGMDDPSQVESRSLFRGCCAGTSSIIGICGV